MDKITIKNVEELSSKIASGVNDFIVISGGEMLNLVQLKNMIHMVIISEGKE